MHVKEHIREHKIVYASVASGITFAGITYFIMRGASQSIGHDVIEAAQHDVIELGKSSAIQKVIGINNTLNSVSYFSADRQGPPSWVVKCKESGNIFSSQNAASVAEEVTISNLSRHLNGLQENANGKHFERICMAA